MLTTSANPQRSSNAIVLAATILGSSMAFVDGTVVNVALPALQSALHATVADVQWVVEAYALLLAALLLVGGSLGDRFGRRRVYVIGVAVFAAASALCGIAHTVHQLIVARAVQGIGAALLVPGSLALISASFPEQQRGRAIGTWSGFTAITAAIGPVIGGWLIEHSTWRWVFFLNLPLALAVLLLSMRMPESRNEEAPAGLDLPGALLATIGLGGVTYALIEFPARARHPHHLILAAGAAGLLSLAMFLVAERRSRAPMVSLALFRSRNFTGANLLTLFLYASLGGLMFFFPLDLIQIRHYTATEAGAAFLPFVGLMFGLSRWSGGLVARYGSRLPLTIGPLVAAVGLALFALPGQDGSYWSTFFPAVIVMGFGMTISVAPLTTTVMSAVPQSESGVASGVNNAVSRIAALLAVAVFGLVLVVRFNHALDLQLRILTIDPTMRAHVDAIRPQLAAARTGDAIIDRAIAQAFVAGYRDVIWMATALAVLSAACAWLILEPGHTSHEAKAVEK